MKIFTIGFTKKTAEEFFEKLITNGIDKVIDIRLNNKSQLAGFAKSNDLQYFLEKLGNINYIHKPEFAPTEDLLKKYRDKKISWPDYQEKYIELLAGRNVVSKIDINDFDNSVLLCSEEKPDKCHRRLFAEYLSNNFNNIEIIHL
jgi:uncharacterized protein (DUF488 family)